MVPGNVRVICVDGARRPIRLAGRHRRRGDRSGGVIPGGLSPHLDHASRVADPFHVVRVANRCLDQVRRRVQNETLGHRGRKRDPLYRIRKILLAGDERLVERRPDRMLLGLRLGDPNDEVLGAWLAKETVRDVYLAGNDATVLLDKAIAGCLADVVPEVASLGQTLHRWRTEILGHHVTGASNGPTEGLNLCVKKAKRCGHGFRSFEHYRLRVLPHAGGVTWPDRPCPPRHQNPELPTHSRRAAFITELPQPTRAAAHRQVGDRPAHNRRRRAGVAKRRALRLSRHEDI